MYDVHVSGHACQEEQKLMLTLAKPQFFIPVHGEYKHLKKHAQTAVAVGVPEQNVYIGENGNCIILSKDGIRESEPVQAGACLLYTSPGAEGRLLPWSPFSRCPGWGWQR